MPHKVIAVGRLTRDTMVFKDKVAKFGLASSEGKDKTKFFNCVAFVNSFAGKSWEYLVALKKGDPIMVSGQLQDETYKNKEGKEVETEVLILNSFNFLGTGGKKKEENGQSDGQGGAAPAKKDAAPVASTPTDDSEDIPF